MIVLHTGQGTNSTHSWSHQGSVPTLCHLFGNTVLPTPDIHTNPNQHPDQQGCNTLVQ